MAFLKLTEQDVQGKTVLIRADMNECTVQKWSNQ